MIYSTRKLRANLKQVLDLADTEPVTISRDGKLYQLKSISLKEMVTVESNIISKKFNIPVAKLQNEVEADVKSNGLPCCSKSKPCQHWQWNGEDAWVNILTGDKREITE